MVDMMDRYRFVLGAVFSQRPYRLLALGLSVAFILFYLMALPATFTGGRIGWVRLQFLTPTFAVFALALGLLAGLTFTLAIYGFRAAAAARGQGTGVVGTVLAILPSMVCCTPLVPTLLALLGASTPTIFALTGRIQGFFATYEIPILTAALLMLAYALHRTVMRLGTGCRFQPAR